VCDFVFFVAISCVNFFFPNNPIFQMSCFCCSSVLFPYTFLKDFQKSFLWLFFDKWIVLLVIISTTLFLIICGLGTHLFCIHHHL
jgi:hypothetical protein